MKIVHIGINLVPDAGGIARSVQLFAAALEQTGNSSFVVSFGRRGFYEPAPGSRKLPNIQFVQVPRVPILERCYWWPAGYGGAMKQILKGADLVVIHGLFFHPGLLAARWADKLGIPYVVVAHGSLDPILFTYRAWRKRAWMWQAGKRTLGGASTVLYSTRAEQRKAAWWTAGGGHVIPWPVQFAPEYDKKAAVRQIQTAHGLPSSARIAVTCGRIHPLKLPIETVETFYAAAPENWFLFVIGPPTPEIPRRVIENVCWATNGRCRYVGPAFGEALHDYFRAAELFVLFSKKENFSHVTAEALAFGVPVLVSSGIDLSHDLAGARADCAVIAGRTEREALKEIFRTTLARTPGELAAMGARGRIWAREHLSFARFRSTLTQLCTACYNGSADNVSL